MVLTNLFQLLNIITQNVVQIERVYLTIIPQTCVGFELLDDGRGAEH